jgi:hypothetical protein
MAQPPIPTAVAMLLCDQVITEQGTNKKSLIGVFENFNWPTFPAVLPRLGIYIKLADAAGKYDFKLRFVALKDESLLAEIGLNTDVRDASSYAEISLNIGNIPIPAEGKYEIQLYFGDVYLHRITMQALKTAGGPTWQPPQHRR